MPDAPFITSLPGNISVRKSLPGSDNRYGFNLLGAHT